MNLKKVPSTSTAGSYFAGTGAATFSRFGDSGASCEVTQLLTEKDGPPGSCGGYLLVNYDTPYDWRAYELRMALEGSSGRLLFFLFRGPARLSWNHTLQARYLERMHRDIVTAFQVRTF